MNAYTNFSNMNNSSAEACACLGILSCGNSVELSSISAISIIRRIRRQANIILSLIVAKIILPGSSVPTVS